MPDLSKSPLKPVEFIGSSKKDLSSFPDPVRQDVGHALFRAQQGSRAPNVKTLHGFGGGGVIEIVEDHAGDTYRCVYTTSFGQVIYVLHAFQKKSKHRRKTPKHEIELVRVRLKEAEARNKEGSWR